mmetsp:Transcript_5567/g.24741  ORF Transcript_5567/g.24741 Transcript_5567/m.24741 type:complete len:263 (-) Transcript_5567:586-1374(-)
MSSRPATHPSSIPCGALRNARDASSSPETKCVGDRSDPTSASANGAIFASVKLEHPSPSGLPSPTMDGHGVCSSASTSQRHAMSAAATCDVVLLARLWRVASSRANQSLVSSPVSSFVAKSVNDKRWSRVPSLCSTHSWSGCVHNPPRGVGRNSRRGSSASARIPSASACPPARSPCIASHATLKNSPTPRYAASGPWCRAGSYPPPACPSASATKRAHRPHSSARDATIGIASGASDAGFLARRSHVASPAQMAPVSLHPL